MIEKKKLPTVNLKGKEYVLVSTRLQEFRQNPAYVGFSLETEVVSHSDTHITLRAVIRNPDGRSVATGMATEYARSRGEKITEVAETSAWGRALGNLGIGIQDSIASAEEIERFFNNVLPKKTPSQPTSVSTNASPSTGEVKDCPQCHAAMAPRTGQYGEYWRCNACAKNYNAKQLIS